jgi:hypothetical protein
MTVRMSAIIRNLKRICATFWGTKTGRGLKSGHVKKMLHCDLNIKLKIN